MCFGHPPNVFLFPTAAVGNILDVAERAVRLVPDTTAENDGRLHAN
jgi:hypothetical protein